MAPSIHTSDRETIRAAQAALTFFVTIWVSREHGFFTAFSPTLKDARALGKLMEERVDNNRQAMVYVPTEDRRMIFVPRDLDQLIITTTTTKGLGQ